jgi:hypothetical protein
LSTTTVVHHPSAAKLRLAVQWSCYFLGVLIIGLVALNLVYTGIEPNSVYGTYWASGNAAIHRQNPYGEYLETFHSNFSRFGGAARAPDLNLNPPSLLPLFQAAAHLPMAQYAIAWNIGSFFIFAIAAALLLWFQPEMQNRQILWLLLARPVFDTFFNGQIYSLLFLFAALAWLFYKSGRETAAAVMIGLFVSIKPTMGLWPVFLFLAGHRKLALRTVWMILGVAALPALFYGPIIYREWLAALAQDQHWIAPINIAIIPLFARHGARTAGVLLAGAVAVSLAAWSWKRKPDFLQTGIVAICAGILCAPLAWFIYVIGLAPLYTARRWGGRRLLLHACSCCQRCSGSPSEPGSI